MQRVRSKRWLALAGVTVVVVMFAIAILAQPLTCAHQMREWEWRTCDHMFRSGLAMGSRFLADVWWYLGANPNLRTERSDRYPRELQGKSLLSIATRSGTEQDVRYLLGRGADPDFPDADGSAPLAWAIKRGDAGIVKALQDAKARKQRVGQ